MVTDQAHMLFGVELTSVEGDDTRRLLSAMLERMQAKRRQRCRILMSQNAEYAAFFMQRVAFEVFKESRGID